MSEVTLELSREGSVSPCHYSADHRVLTLSFGSTKFLLLPPDRASSLRMYPYLHPSAGWCKATLSSIPGAQLTGAGVWEVTLMAGEMLYVPPMWLLEADTLETTIGLSGSAQVRIYFKGALQLLSNRHM